MYVVYMANCTEVHKPYKDWMLIHEMYLAIWVSDNFPQKIMGCDYSSMPYS